MGRQVAPPSPWQREAPRRAPSPALEGRLVVDVAVVGAGLAGSSAALHLAREHPGARIALLEARTVGDGATGRSTGVIGPGVGSGILGLRSRWGDARATAMFSATMDAVDLTLKLVQNESIECHLEHTSQVVAARTQLHARKLRRQAAAFTDLGFDVPYLGADELADIVGADCYLAGIRYSQVATVDPYLLCVGVAERAVAAGVQLFEHTPVHRVANGPGTVLQSPAGRVHARHVVLANDGSPTGARPVDRSVVPIDTHVVRTAPLPPALLESLGWRAGPRSSTAAPSSTTTASPTTTASSSGVVRSPTAVAGAIGMHPRSGFIGDWNANWSRSSRRWRGCRSPTAGTGQRVRPLTGCRWLAR